MMAAVAYAKTIDILMFTVFVLYNVSQRPMILSVNLFSEVVQGRKRRSEGSKSPGCLGQEHTCQPMAVGYFLSCT